MNDSSDLYVSTHDIGDDAGEQNVLLVFVGTFLREVNNRNDSIFSNKTYHVD